MQNKPNFFFWKHGFPKGGEGGGGSDTWEKFPKNPVFFCGQRPIVNPIKKSFKCQNLLTDKKTCDFWGGVPVKKITLYHASIPCHLPSRFCCSSGKSRICQEVYYLQYFIITHWLSWSCVAGISIIIHHFTHLMILNEKGHISTHNPTETWCSPRNKSRRHIQGTPRDCLKFWSKFNVERRHLYVTTMEHLCKPWWIFQWHRLCFHLHFSQWCQGPSLLQPVNTNFTIGQVGVKTLPEAQRIQKLSLFFSLFNFKFCLIEFSLHVGPA